jgi:hypothetical protein
LELEFEIIDWIVLMNREDSEIKKSPSFKKDDDRNNRDEPRESDMFDTENAPIIRPEDEVFFFIQLVFLG